MGTLRFAHPTDFFPWHLVRRVGVFSRPLYGKVVSALAGLAHKPAVEIRREWYL